MTTDNDGTPSTSHPAGNEGASAKRKAISKKTRFEVFNRDQFKCRYCGANPPKVVLHIDRLIEPSARGSSQAHNLVTACQRCVMGKGVLESKSDLATLKSNNEMLGEREAQLTGYQKFLEAKWARVKTDLWLVGEILDPAARDQGITPERTASIKRFNERLGVLRAMELAHVACARCKGGKAAVFSYFCGCCWHEIRAQDKT